MYHNANEARILQIKLASQTILPRIINAPHSNNPSFNLILAKGAKAAFNILDHLGTGINIHICFLEMTLDKLRSALLYRTFVLKVILVSTAWELKTSALASWSSQSDFAFLEVRRATSALKPMLICLVDFQHYSVCHQKWHYKFHCRVRHTGIHDKTYHDLRK